MLKIYLLLLAAFVCSSVAFAQTDSLSAKDKAMLDSMMEKDEFLKLMKDPSRSSLDMSVGVGNGAFSTHNNAANATGVDNKLIITPGMVYHTKSGFSFGATAFLTDDSTSSSKLYQTGLSAGYDYSGKEVNAGITYTRYLSDMNKFNTKSLYQNDIYGYIKKASGIIQPGLALGFNNGQYKEAAIASGILKRPLRGDTTITGIDSTENKTSFFSVTFIMAHDFSFYSLFSKDDEFDFTPSLLLNVGKDDLTQTHINSVNRVFLKKLLNKRKKIQPDNKFEVQSVAASLECTYGVGKFYLQPNFYVDYYLPQTTANRLTAIFSLTAGFTF